jgi:hypothetical protein
MAYTIETTYFGAMPNQAYGTLNGQRFYWRARHGDWTLYTATSDEELFIPGRFTIAADGEDPKAGWWDDAECRTHLTALLTRLEAKTVPSPLGVADGRHEAFG